MAEGKYYRRFPWPRRKEKDVVELELDPVLLIPGIGGSILNAISKDGKKERVWIRLFNADREFRTKMWSKYNSATGKTESVDPEYVLQVPDDNFGLYAIDTLEPDLTVPVDMVNYYHNMMVEMRTWGYKDGTTLFGFGFDFRQSNRLSEVMDSLIECLRNIHLQTGKKVRIITHSMGGLLVKSFVALHKEEFAEHVSSWIAIASPFQGAPGFIMDTLLTGVEFLDGWEKDLFITKWSMHQLLVECPSVYELMTDYKFAWKDVPELRLFLSRESGDGLGEEVVVKRYKTFEQVVHVLETALKDNQISVNGNTIDIPLNMKIVEWALETKQMWKSVELPIDFAFYNIYGTGLDTPFHTSYGSVKEPIKNLSEVLHKKAVFDNVDGDGTVPIESSRNDGLNATFRVGVSGEHRALLRDPRVFRLVKYFLEVPELDNLYDPITDFVIFPSKCEVEAEMSGESPGNCNMGIQIESSSVSLEISDVPGTNVDVHISVTSYSANPP